MGMLDPSGIQSLKKTLTIFGVHEFLQGQEAVKNLKILSK